MARIIDGKNMNMIGSRLRTLRVERGWSQRSEERRVGKEC